MVQLQQEKKEEKKEKPPPINSREELPQKVPGNSSSTDFGNQLLIMFLTHQNTIAVLRGIKQAQLKGKK
jgi:hypothetical protein